MTVIRKRISFPLSNKCRTFLLEMLYKREQKSEMKQISYSSVEFLDQYRGIWKKISDTTCLLQAGNFPVERFRLARHPCFTYNYPGKGIGPDKRKRIETNATEKNVELRNIQDDHINLNHVT